MEWAFLVKSIWIPKNRFPEFVAQNTSAFVERVLTLNLALFISFFTNSQLICSAGIWLLIKFASSFLFDHSAFRNSRSKSLFRRKEENDDKKNHLDLYFKATSYFRYSERNDERYSARPFSCCVHCVRCRRRELVKYLWCSSLAHGIHNFVHYSWLV